MSAPLKEAIGHAYGQIKPGRKLESLRNTLKNSVELCPLCGISAPQELDHFLPKSEFEVLAIYARNLVPVCELCNKKKGVIANPKPEERFVHAYLDLLPDVDFIFAEVVLLDGGLVVDYSIESVAGLSLDLHACLKFQFGKLSINERLQKETNIFLSSQVVALHDSFDGGGGGAVSSLLLKQAKQHGSQFGRNDWRTALLRSLSQHKEFYDGGFKTVLPPLA